MNWADRLRETIERLQREELERLRRQPAPKVVIIGDLSGRMPGGINHIPEEKS